MGEVPPEMLRRGRPADQEFSDEELLFLRFRGDQYSPATGIGVDAIKVPDLSVNRQKYGGRAEHLLADKDHLLGYYAVWGVAKFRVDDIPREISHLGEHYTFEPVHDPEAHNYFHTEVRCFDSEQERVTGLRRLPHRAAMRWRQRLWFRLKVCIAPKSLDE